MGRHRKARRQRARERFMTIHPGQHHDVTTMLAGLIAHAQRKKRLPSEVPSVQPETPVNQAENSNGG
jgi:hypothetical protein